MAGSEARISRVTAMRRIYRRPRSATSSASQSVGCHGGDQSRRSSTPARSMNPWRAYSGRLAVSAEKHRIGASLGAEGQCRLQQRRSQAEVSCGGPHVETRYVGMSLGLVHRVRQLLQDLHPHRAEQHAVGLLGQPAVPWAGLRRDDRPSRRYTARESPLRARPQGRAPCGARAGARRATAHRSVRPCGSVAPPRAGWGAMRVSATSNHSRGRASLVVRREPRRCSRAAAGT